MIHDRLRPAAHSQWRKRACSACGHVDPWNDDRPFTEDHRMIYVPRCSCGWVGEPTTEPESAHAEHVREEDASQTYISTPGGMLEAAE